MARSTFLGRARDLARVIDLLSSCTIVTVIGPGGVGKTRLVREACEELADNLVDEVVFCELGALPAGSDVDAIAGEAGWTSPEAAAVALAQRNALLVLDNCEHLVTTAAAFVRRLVDTADVQVLATSREPLGVSDEGVVVLEPLPVADRGDVERSPAVQLFLDRAAAAGATVDTSPAGLETIATVCSRLDGLPLAIELAASRMRAMSPAEVLANLDRRLELLRRRGDDGDRHASMAAAVDVSLELLSEREHELLCELAAFAGPFTADIAHALSGQGDVLDTIDHLSRLVDRSLLTAKTGPRTQYRIWELVRDRCLHRLEPARIDALHGRLVDVMAAEADRVVVEALGGWTPELIARISASYSNLRLAIEWVIAHDASPDRAFRLMLPLYAAVHQNRPAEVVDIGERVLRRWPSDDAPWRAEAFAVVATGAVLTGDLERAGTFALASEQAAATRPEPSVIATMVSARSRGLAARAVGALDDAASYFEAAHAAAVALGARSFARELAGFQASVLDLQGRTDDAIAMTDAVIDEATRAGDRFTEAWARLLASTALLRAGRVDDARVELERAAAIASDVVWWSGAVRRQRAMVIGLDPSGGWDASVPHWRAAVEAGAAHGSLGEMALTARAAAAIAARCGRGEIAAALLAAMPVAKQMTVLPELFPNEVKALLETTPVAAPPLSANESLRRLRALLDEHGGDDDNRSGDQSPASRTRSDRRANAVVDEGDTWAFTFDGETVRLRALKGFVDVTTLLAAPGKDVHCLELVGAAADTGHAGVHIDAAARSAYEQRIRDLQEDIDEARAANDTARAERAEVELDALVDELARSLGLRGRARVAGSTSERARTAVTYRIRAALRRIDEMFPALGKHLRTSVSTGTWCSYRPDGDVTWELTVRG